MVKAREDLTGKIFGRLKVISQAEDYVKPDGSHYARWNCLCSCGNPKVKKVTSNDLKCGKTTSCGCVQRERTANASRKENRFDLDSEDYAIGYTSKGEPFWFDKEDYELVKQYCWYYSANGYVMYKGKNKSIFLHRLVMGVTDSSIQVDHIVHPYGSQHKIDNRKSNLRLVTNQQNSMNSALYKNNTSGRTGVYWHKKIMKWIASICVNEKSIYLGIFTNKEDAIAARKDAEKKYFGEYSYKEINTEEN